MMVRGFTLLELLLSLVVAMMILLASVMQYHHYERHIRVAAVKNNVRVIFSALGRYYHSAHCTVSDGVPGSFPAADLNTDIYPQLVSSGFLLPAQLNAEPDYITAYHAQVSYDVVNKPVAKNHKPVYQLEVLADVNAQLSAVQKEALAHLWGASIAGTVLIWRVTPALLYHHAQGSSAFWVYSQYVRLFREQENTLNNTEASNSSCLV